MSEQYQTFGGFLEDKRKEKSLSIRKLAELLKITPAYLSDIEKIDIDLFKKETQEYNKLVKTYLNAKSDEELNILLLDTFEKLGIKKAWEGDFDEHMSNKEGTLVFE